MWILILYPNLCYNLARIESAIDAEGEKEDHDHHHDHNHDHDHDHHHHHDEKHDHKHGTSFFIIRAHTSS